MVARRERTRLDRGNLVGLPARGGAVAEHTETVLWLNFKNRWRCDLGGCDGFPTDSYLYGGGIIGESRHHVRSGLPNQDWLT